MVQQIGNIGEHHVEKRSHCKQLSVAALMLAIMWGAVF